MIDQSELEAIKNWRWQAKTENGYYQDGILLNVHNFSLNKQSRIETYYVLLDDDHKIYKYQQVNNPAIFDLNITPKKLRKYADELEQMEKKVEALKICLI